MALLKYLISHLTRAAFYHMSSRLAFKLKLWKKVKVGSLKIANGNDIGSNN